MDLFSGPWIVFNDGAPIESYDSKEEAEDAEIRLRSQAVRSGGVGHCKIQYDDGWQLAYGHLNKWNRQKI